MVDGSDWRLDSNLFRQIMTQEGHILCHLFAARHTRQLPRYVSWQPDPEAVAVDALSLPGHMWEGAYLFPPFALVGRCLQFILRHQIFRAVLVAPVNNVVLVKIDFFLLFGTHALGAVFNHTHPCILLLICVNLCAGTVCAGYV